MLVSTSSLAEKLDNVCLVLQKKVEMSLDPGALPVVSKSKSVKDLEY